MGHTVNQNQRTQCIIFFKFIKYQLGCRGNLTQRNLIFVNRIRIYFFSGGGVFHRALDREPAVFQCLAVDDARRADFEVI